MSNRYVVKYPRVFIEKFGQKLLDAAEAELGVSSEQYGQFWPRAMTAYVLNRQAPLRYINCNQVASIHYLNKARKDIRHVNTCTDFAVEIVFNPGITTVANIVSQAERVIRTELGYEAIVTPCHVCADQLVLLIELELDAIFVDDPVWDSGIWGAAFSIPVDMYQLHLLVPSSDAALQEQLFYNNLLQQYYIAQHRAWVEHPIEKAPESKSRGRIPDWHFRSFVYAQERRLLMMDILNTYGEAYTPLDSMKICQAHVMSENKLSTISELLKWKQEINACFQTITSGQLVDLFMGIAYPDNARALATDYFDGVTLVSDRVSGVNRIPKDQIPDQIGIWVYKAFTFACHPRFDLDEVFEVFQSLDYGIFREATVSMCSTKEGVTVLTVQFHLLLWSEGIQHILTMLEHPKFLPESLTIDNQKSERYSSILLEPPTTQEQFKNKVTELLSNRARRQYSAIENLVFNIWPDLTR